MGTIRTALRVERHRLLISGLYLLSGVVAVYSASALFVHRDHDHNLFPLFQLLIWTLVAVGSRLGYYRLSDHERATVSDVVRSGDPSGDATLDLVAWRRLNALPRSSGRGSAVALAVAGATAVGLVIAAGVVRSPWWVLGLLPLITATWLTVRSWPRDRAGTRQRLAALESGMRKLREPYY